LDEIQRLRARIDGIDQEIALLLKSRNEDARLLGRIKRIRGMPLQDPKRERTILDRMTRLSKELNLEPGMVQKIFQEIFRLSFRAQDETQDRRVSRLKGLRVLVIGGTGRMGRFIAGFASLQGARVRVVGRSIEKTAKAAKEIGVEPGTIPDATESDIVIVSVPLEETERVAVETASFMKAGSLLSDVSSVKTGVSDRIAAQTSSVVEYVSIHPLFGPDIDQLYGQNVVMIPFRIGPCWKRLDMAFRASGVNMYEMTAAQHDRRMAYAQGLHHFALIMLGVALADKGGEPRTRSLRDTEKRILGMIENWETIRAIQMMNPFVPEARQDFLRISDRLEGMRPRDTALARRKLLSNVQKWSRKR